MKPSLRFAIFERDGFTCGYCGRRPPAVELQVDHIIPRAKGGGDALMNLITCCSLCNMGKGARLLSRARTRYFCYIAWRRQAEFEGCLRECASCRTELRISAEAKRCEVSGQLWYCHACDAREEAA